MIIYKITNKITGKCYIGQTIQKFERRMRFHCKAYIKNKSAIKNAIMKHGEANFTFEIICSALSKEYLDELEKHFIAYYNSVRPNGYNLTTGGQNGQIFTDEVRKKMSDKAKGRPSSMKGRHHTEETKKLLSDLGKKQLHVLGHRWTEEQKQKLSESKTGLPSSKKGKHYGPNLKLSEYQMGRKRGPMTKEHSLKISQGKMGKVSGKKGKTYGPQKNPSPSLSSCKIIMTDKKTGIQVGFLSPIQAAIAGYGKRASIANAAYGITKGTRQFYVTRVLLDNESKGI
jgi:group I intron endonuclease